MNTPSRSTGFVRWGIVATVSEPAPLIAAFVAHHLELGAHRITLHLDRADPEVEDIISGMEDCELILSNSEWWSSVAPDGLRPEDHRVRQKLNANATLKTSDLDWLLHLDADEFLEIDGNISDALRTLGSDFDAAHITNHERIFFRGREQENLFEGYSRRPFRAFGRIGPILYGKDTAKFLNRGMVGHNNGKTFVRTGRDVRLDIHYAANAKRTAKLKRIRIVHFDGITKLHWIDKLYSKTLTSREIPEHKRSFPRKSLVDFAAGPGVVRKKLERLFEDIMTWTPAQAIAMRLFGHARPIHVNPVKAVRRRLAADALDFSPEAFDSRVMSRRWPISYRKASLNVSLLDNFTERLLAVQGASREELELEHLLEKLSLRDVTIVDVGANIGLYSIVLGVAASSRSRIIAVECSPEPLRRLRTNLNSNQLDRVEILEAAISDKSGKAVLNFVADDNLDGATLVGASNTTPSIEVEALTLLDALDRYGVKKADFIKLDVEGHELAIIDQFMKDAHRQRWPDRMLFEMKHDEVAANQLHTLLKVSGYIVELKTKHNVIYKYREEEG